MTSCSHLAAYIHKHTTCKLLCQPVSKPVVVAPQQCQCIDARPDMQQKQAGPRYTRWKSSAEARNWQSFFDQPAEESPPSPPFGHLYRISYTPARPEPRAASRQESLPATCPSFCAVIRPAYEFPFCPSVPPSLFLHRGGGRSAGVRGSGVRSLSPTPLATALLMNGCLGVLAGRESWESTISASEDSNIEYGNWKCKHMCNQASKRVLSFLYRPGLFVKFTQFDTWF